MITRPASQAMLFAFVASMTGPAVWAAPDHDIRVGVNNNHVQYTHKNGKGQNGYVYLKQNHVVQWSCDSAPCDRVGIQFTSTPPCKETDFGPATTVTCTVNLSYVNSACTKASSGAQCSLYHTFVYPPNQSNPLPLVDDPEFIVDGNAGPLQIGAVILTLLLGLGASGFAGYRWGKGKAT